MRAWVADRSRCSDAALERYDAKVKASGQDAPVGLLAALNNAKAARKARVSAAIKEQLAASAPSPSAKRRKTRREGGAGRALGLDDLDALEAAAMSLPDLLRKRIGSRLILEQTDVWQLDAGHGRIDIDIEKTPVAITIDLRLRDDRGTARLDLRFDIDAEVPLLGSKIEKAVAEPITRRVRDDLEVSRAMAADYAEPAA